MAQSSWILGVQTEERKGGFQPLAFHNVTRTADFFPRGFELYGLGRFVYA